MLNIVLFGPPGAGKGTQSERLIEKYNLVHLSTGDVFRANIKGETELGKLAKSYMDAGQLVPDAVTIDMLRSEVAKHTDPKGFIFDGFPRTKAQAEALDKLLDFKTAPIQLVISLEVPEEELVRRLVERGITSGRSDDNEEVISKRIREYYEKTAPVASYYDSLGKLVRLVGNGTIEATFELIKRNRAISLTSLVEKANFVDYIRVFCHSGKGGAGGGPSCGRSGFPFPWGGLPA